jgi:outer membrane lipoprotein-sorting protein
LADWQAADTASGQSAAAAVPAAATLFPRTIQIERPHEEYKLDLQVSKIVLNEEIPAERFKLEQPAGSELTRVGEAPENKQP